MSGFRFLLCVLVALAASFSAACQKKLPPPKLQLTLPVVGPAAPPEPLPRPEVDISPMTFTRNIEVAETVLPPPPPIPEPKRVRRTAPAASATKAEEDLSESPPELPQLGEVLSQQQQRDYTQETEASLDQAKKIAVVVQRRALDPRQADVLGQVQGFIRQAEAAQKKDIPLARNLAQRAEVLAKDLLSSLK